MNEDNYIGPQYQLMPPTLPDYGLLLQSCKKLGYHLAEIFGTILDDIKQAIQPIIDVFVNAWSDFNKPPCSRLRLPRHYIQHERRGMWRIAHPAMPRTISHKRAMIYRRKMAIA